MRRPPGAGVVAAACALDLGHLGAEVGQGHRRERAGEDAGEVEDPQVSERRVGH
jgi:hypothetical protein